MKNGFTLLELLIVVVIIGILAIIAVPSLLNATEQARENAVIANVSAAASSVASRFALYTNETALNVASNVAMDLNNSGDIDNPFKTSADAFATTGATSGLVVITGTSESPKIIVITGYGVSDAIITKTVRIQ